MNPPAELLNWASDAAKKRGLREAMLALAGAIASQRVARASRPESIGQGADATVPLIANAPVDWIGQVYEALLAQKTRRARGVHFTPPEVAAEVVAATLEPLAGKPLRIIDPAMGCGAFLLAAARFCRDKACLAPGHDKSCGYFGFDTDPLAVELARISLSLETGAVSLDGLRVGDSLLELGRGAPAQSFDAVIGNPPFGNAIEKRTARSRGYDAKMRALFPEFAQGAYDTCLLFFALATRLLAPHGRFGLIGPSALLSAGKPWQRFMHERFRPRALFLYPVDRFGAARIRTTAFIGAAGPCESVEIRDHESGERVERAWREGTWNETVRQSPPVTATKTLGDFVDIFAGCATGAAYELKPLVKEARALGVSDGIDTNARSILPSLTQWALVNTGAIDRYRCKWGLEPIRFLGRDFTRPVWPLKGPRSVVAALTRQQRPKILVGGLTSVIEAWFDESGAAAGVVSTWVLAPKHGVDAWTLLALLNSATLSRIYMARHGAKSMSGRQTTIYKRALLELPMANVGANHGSPLQGARELQSLSGREFDALDNEIHLAAAKVLGRSEAEARDDLRWWRERVAKNAYSPSPR